MIIYSKLARSLWQANISQNIAFIWQVCQCLQRVMLDGQRALASSLLGQLLGGHPDLGSAEATGTTMLKDSDQQLEAPQKALAARAQLLPSWDQHQTAVVISVSTVGWSCSPSHQLEQMSLVVGLLSKLRTHFEKGLKQ